MQGFGRGENRRASAFMDAGPESDAPGLAHEAAMLQRQSLYSPE